MRTIRNHLTYANVISSLALLIALGMGSAYAADRLAPKSVGAPELRPGAVTADKIRKNAVTAPKIKSQAVKQGKVASSAIVTEKLASGAVTGAKIAADAVTPDKIPNNSVGGEKVEESSLSQVPSAETADVAITAETSNPEAFAKVSSEGTVFPGDSKGIRTTDVKQGKFPGIYCVNVPGFAPRGAQATPEYGAGNDVSIFVKFGGTESCGPSEVEVRNYNAGSPQKGPFYIVFYR
jgi:hypothetical protein